MVDHVCIKGKKKLESLKPYVNITKQDKLSSLGEKAVSFSDILTLDIHFKHVVLSFLSVYSHVADKGRKEGNKPCLKNHINVIFGNYLIYV